MGQSILGYSNDELDKKIFLQAKKGVISSLNCYEEVQLAKKILKFHPWASMVKFARSGGEANACS